MDRDERAYLSDVVQACTAIEDAVGEVDFETYSTSRLIRSSVEREFTIIGEALNALSKIAPATFARISHGKRIIAFRNRLTHAYPTIDNTVVWATALRDARELQAECVSLLGESQDEGGEV